MSNVIRDVEKLNQRQLETAKRRNEREIKNINNAHEAYKTDLKKTQAEEVVDIQNEHHTHLNVKAEKKEKVLEEMKKHLNQTKELTEKELKTLATLSAKEKNELQQKLTNDRERINGEHELYLEEINDRFNQSSRKIGHDGNMRLQEVKSSLNDELLQTQKTGQDKVNKKTEEFTARFQGDQRKYQTLKDNQDNQFKKERLGTNLRQQTELKKMTDTHTSFIEQRDGNYRKGLKEQDLFFEKKYAKQIDAHNGQFKELEVKNKKVIEDLKTSLSKELAKSAERNDDPFYRFETLKPEVKTFENHVEVRVEVPEHSKQDVQLTVNGKEAIVSFNRRFADASKEQDGTVNKINKIESFTTRLQTGHFLNAKEMKSSYENGAMTYVIKKA